MKHILLLLALVLPLRLAAQTLDATPTHDHVFGKVVFDDGQPAIGEIEFTNSLGTTAGKVNLAADGRFEILLPKRGTYSFRFHNGMFVHYFNQPENALNTSAGETLSSLELNFTVMQYGLGTSLNLSGMQFEPHSDVIREEDKKKLDFLAEWLKARPQIKIQSAGHANEEVDEPANKVLSKKRAAACLNYLVAAGIPAEQILTYGYGSTRPNPGMENFASQNRRTSFIIVENPTMPKPGINPK